MASLKYLNGYPPELLTQVQQLIDGGRLGSHLKTRYPERHAIQSDRALYDYTMALKQQHLRSAPPIHHVSYAARLDVIQNALGLHSTVSRNHGGKLKAKKDIRIAALFKEAPPEFLKMIVVHELAHLREHDHNKAFYRLCESMLPGYHQIEFDLRLYLTWRDLPDIKQVSEP
jgi:predicted metal-dependent hydrolase